MMPIRKQVALSCLVLAAWVGISLGQEAAVPAAAAAESTPAPVILPDAGFIEVDSSLIKAVKYEKDPDRAFSVLFQTGSMATHYGVPEDVYRQFMGVPATKGGFYRGRIANVYSTVKPERPSEKKAAPTKPKPPPRIKAEPKPKPAADVQPAVEAAAPVQVEGGPAPAASPAEPPVAAKAPAPAEPSVPADIPAPAEVSASAEQPVEIPAPAEPEAEAPPESPTPSVEPRLTPRLSIPENQEESTGAVSSEADVAPPAEPAPEADAVPAEPAPPAEPTVEPEALDLSFLDEEALAE
jgi:hypothetical protein